MHLRQWLDGAHFVVDLLHSSHSHPGGADCSTEGLNVNLSMKVHRHQDWIRSGQHPIGSAQHRRVLDRTGHHLLPGPVRPGSVRPGALPSPSQSQQAQVQGLTARGGESHLLGQDSDAGGNRGPGGIEQLPGEPALAVQPRGIGPAMRERSYQGLPRLLLEGKPGGCVEVARHAPHGIASPVAGRPLTALPSPCPASESWGARRTRIHQAIYEGNT